MLMEPKKIIKSLSELPTMPSTIGTMAWNQTGDWRFLTPVVANKAAPCRRNCPAGIPIPDYLSAVKQGDVQTGLALLLAYNPLPGLTGRLCYHPCQTNCTRKKIDTGISIQEIERFMAELGADVKSRQNRRSDKRVTVVGSGPLGLSCAFFLGYRGLRVTVLEVNSRAGGALASLSEKKLESQILEDEISRLIRIADIHLEIGAVFDFNRPGSLSNPDLTILDPTGLSKESGASAGSVAFNPFADEHVRGDIIAVTLPENLTPFKAPMIAHYIAAGRRTAENVFCRLIGSPVHDIGKPIPELFLQAWKLDSTPVMNCSTSVSSIGEGTKHEGALMREWVLQETGRCLSCGTCNLCLQCFSSCPEACIRLNDDKTSFTIDLDFCKGCGLCAYECPRGVITMEEVGA
jgi:Pyruvate/2-oxoacid:ferredoxin oxidoreductase delta subunit